MASNELKLVMDVVLTLSKRIHDKEAIEELTVAFRKLRNKCAEGSHLQNEIYSYGDLVDCTFAILQAILDINNTDESQDLCLLVGLQMIANLLVNNKEIQSTIWERYHNKVISCLRRDNHKLQNCAAMIMHNVFLSDPKCIVHDKNVFHHIVALTAGEQYSEFAIYLVQLYISKTNYIQNIYNSLMPEIKLKLLCVIHDYSVKEEQSLGKDLAQFFIESFLSKSKDFINILEKTEYCMEVYETIRILELLSSIAGNESDLKVLQNNESLLLSSIDLLKVIHKKSKEPGNNLSRIQRLSELDNLEHHAKLEECPGFGIKANIIRLIGNVCWKNRANQNKVRYLDGIPLLLDCCSIDGRNPFILQWAILAIRNLCDDNQENQKFISSMESKGTIDVNKMKEMGIVLNCESDGSCISIAPLQRKD